MSPPVVRSGVLGPFSPRFVLRSTTDPALADVVVDVLLQSLTSINERIRQHARAAGRPLPLLYQMGVRYRRENYFSTFPEDWQDVLELQRTKVGDCEDLACARAAELRDGGEPARAVFIARPRPEGGRLLHIVVHRANGTVEDPSKILGMQGDG